MPDRAPLATVHCRPLPTILRAIETATAAMRTLRMRQRRTRAAALRAITRLVDAQQARLDRLYIEKRIAHAAAALEPV